MKLKILFFCILALTIYGGYIAWFTMYMNDLEKLGAFGSWVGGVSALIALLLAAYEYRMSQLREALSERYNMVCSVLPDLSRNWINFITKSLALAMEIKIYKQKVNDCEKFEETFSKNVSHRSELDYYKRHCLLKTKQDYFAEVVHVKYEELREMHGSLGSSFNDFQECFNKIRFASNYYFKVIKPDFENFKEMCKEAIEIIEYINNELESVSHDKHYREIYEMQFGKSKIKDTKSSIEIIIEDIEVEDYVKDIYSDSKLWFKVAPSLFDKKNKFFKCLIGKLEINNLNFARD